MHGFPPSWIYTGHTEPFTATPQPAQRNLILHHLSHPLHLPLLPPQERKHPPNLTTPMTFLSATPPSPAAKPFAVPAAQPPLHLSLEALPLSATFQPPIPPQPAFVLALTPLAPPLPATLSPPLTNNMLSHKATAPPLLLHFSTSLAHQSPPNRGALSSHPQSPLCPPLLPPSPLPPLPAPPHLHPASLHLPFHLVSVPHSLHLHLLPPPPNSSGCSPLYHLSTKPQNHSHNGYSTLESLFQLPT